MTITSFQDLREWFKFGFEKGANTKEEGRETSSPYWTLYSVGLGGKDTVLAFNDRLTSMDESLTALVENIRRMNNPQGSTFRIFQTYRPRFNYATQEARVQIFENNLAGMGGTAAIGTLPAGYMDESKIAEIRRQDREKWEMEKRLEDLEAQIKAPRNSMENALEMVERIGKTPVGIMILSKMSGLPIGEVMKSISGLGDQDSDTSPLPDGDFDSNIEKTSQILGVTDEQLAARLRQFAEMNPDLARQIFHSQ